MSPQSNQPKHNPFPSFDGGDLNLGGEYDDNVFFEEAFSNRSTSNSDPNRSFMGSIVPKARFTSAILMVCLVFSIFVVKTAYLQIVNGEEYRMLAEENRILHKTLPAQRGVIYDRNGIVLAENIPTFNIIVPSYTLFDTEYHDDIYTIANHLKIDVNEITTQYDEDPDTDILLAEYISYDQALFCMSYESQYPWLSVETNALRQYITDEIPTLSHILGYTSGISEQEYDLVKGTGYRQFDHIGKQGLEKEYEKQLRGSYGEELLEVDARGNIERIISKVEPENGTNLYTTLDANLQSYIEDTLTARMEGTGASRGSVIVMDAQDGSILSLVSWPAYDANLFASGIDEESYIELVNDEDQPLYPRATSGEFPSGSTIKPVFAAAALIEEVITPYTTFTSTGGIWVSIWFFPDWRAGGHGLTNVYHAIADSVNTFFYYIGGGSETFEGLGLDRMMQYASLFGFGDTTGIDLPGEADGFLPSMEWKEEVKGEQWYIGDTYHVAIGQGDLLTTPLQIAQSTAVFANGGSLVTPHINSELEVESKVIIDESTATIIQDAMRQTVTDGSATALQSAPVTVAGKTGTAQWSTAGVPHSWFTGFAPYDNAEIVITVLIEEGGGDYYIAVPITLDILNYWFSNESL
ncbi:penicillin-binding protein 2 [Candidatus Uhrbacteria bacterium]|jgi:penicillin-binding protein 2|nr:penicillin-binding protein 2 [Candidatus Uhrbacteria bacterium]MBT7717440.1 penicillin-binding protein 2 [Candidatus Uhrbacteria bacterium]